MTDDEANEMEDYLLSGTLPLAPSRTESPRAMPPRRRDGLASY